MEEEEEEEEEEEGILLINWTITKKKRLTKTLT